MAKIVHHTTANVEVWSNDALPGRMGAVFYVSRLGLGTVLARVFVESVDDAETARDRAIAIANAAQARVGAPAEVTPNYSEVAAAIVALKARQAAPS